MKICGKQFNHIEITQYLITASLVAIAISPPLANFFIALSAIMTLSIKSLRNNLIQFFRTKLGFVCMAFIAIILFSLLHGIEEKSVITSSIWGWKKFLMLPIAAAVFMNAPDAKQKLINLFWLSCLALTLYSFITYSLPHVFNNQNFQGVVVRNYVTQALFFSVAALIALANAMNVTLQKWQRILSLASIPLFISNIALIAIGRSGYIAIIVMMVGYIFTNKLQMAITKKIAIALISSMTLTTIFLASPTSLERIERAKNEFQTGIKSTETTSIGLRLTFWKNTIDMIPDYYLIGAGAGGFEKAYSAHIQNKQDLETTLTADPHNQYLKILIEHGVVGLIIFLAIIILLMKQNSSLPFKSIGSSALIAFCFTSLANSHFSTFNEGLFIWIFTGSLLASDNSLDISK